VTETPIAAASDADFYTPIRGLMGKEGEARSELKKFTRHIRSTKWWYARQTRRVS